MTNNYDTFALFSHSIIIEPFRNIAINEPVNVLVAFDAHFLLFCMLTSIGNLMSEMAPIADF